MSSPYTNILRPDGGSFQTLAGGYNKANRYAIPPGEADERIDAAEWLRVVGSVDDLIERGRNAIYATDYGLSTSGSGADNTTALAAAVAAAFDNNIARVHIPRGTYDFAKSGQSIVDLSSQSGLIISGDGPGTVLRMTGSGGGSSWYFFKCRSTSNILFRDLTLDGNKANLTSLDEQTHLVEVEISCSHIDFENCHFKDAYGDGIKVVGDTGTTVNYLRVRGCTFETNGRSGITVQRAFNRSIITDCIFINNTDQAIDFEPTGTTGPQELLIANNVIVHSDSTIYTVTLSGIGNADPQIRCKFVNNTIVGGCIQSVAVEEMIFSGNHLYVTDAALDAAVEFKKQCRRLVVDSNIINANIPGLKVALQTAGNVQESIISNNAISAVGTGIVGESCRKMNFVGNMVIANTGTNNHGIYIRSVDNECDYITISGNQFHGFTKAVRLQASPNNFSEVVVCNNHSSGDTYFIEFDATTGTFPLYPVVSGNFYDGSPINGIGNVTAITMSGDPNGVGCFGGNGVPSFSASNGSSYHRFDGGVGSTFYILESGTWTAK